MKQKIHLTDVAEEAIINDSKNPKKQQLLKEGFNQHVLVQGKNYFRFFNQPIGALNRWCVKVKFYYNTLTKNYLLLTDKQQQAIQQLSIALYTDPNTVPLMYKKSNKEGLNIRPKERLVVEGCRFEITKGVGAQRLEFGDPGLLLLPYSDYKADCAGNSLEALRTKTDLNGKLAYPNLFNVYDKEGNLLDGESVCVEVAGEKQSTTYRVSPDSPVRIPEAILDNVFKFEDALNYASDQLVEQHIRGELERYGITNWQVKVGKETKTVTEFKI